MKVWEARQKKLSVIAYENYRMLSGIWGICEDFKFELTSEQIVLVGALYESIMGMNISWLIGQIEEHGYTAEYGKELKKFVKWGQAILEKEAEARGISETKI